MPSIRHASTVQSPWTTGILTSHLPLPAPDLSHAWRAMPDHQQHAYQRAVNHLLTMSDDGVSMNAFVKPLIAEIATEPNPKQLTLARALCQVMAEHNQEPWLHERMTFHALADIQEWSQTPVASEPVTIPTITNGHADRLGLSQVLHINGARRTYQTWLQQSDQSTPSAPLYSAIRSDGTTIDDLPPISVNYAKLGSVLVPAPRPSLSQSLIVFDPSEMTFKDAARLVGA